jgi:ribonuclease HII
VPHTALVGGDDACYSIACASIVAKVTRDRLMHSLAGRYPTYVWERNVGYGTLAHLQGLATHGLTPHHRRSFDPVRQIASRDRDDPVDLGALAALLEALPVDGDPTAPAIESQPLK